jgi:hypothetical protein
MKRGWAIRWIIFWPEATLERKKCVCVVAVNGNKDFAISIQSLMRQKKAKPKRKDQETKDRNAMQGD